MQTAPDPYISLLDILAEINIQQIIIIDCEAEEIVRLLASICLSVKPLSP